MSMHSAYGGRFWRLKPMDELTSNCFVSFLVGLFLCILLLGFDGLFVVALPSVSEFFV